MGDGIEKECQVQHLLLHPKTNFADLLPFSPVNALTDWARIGAHRLLYHSTLGLRVMKKKKGLIRPKDPPGPVTMAKKKKLTDLRRVLVNPRG